MKDLGEYEAVVRFVRRVNERVDRNIQAGGDVCGAHCRAMIEEIHVLEQLLQLEHSGNKRN